MASCWNGTSAQLSDLHPGQGVFRLRKNRQMMFYLLTFACQITKWALAERASTIKSACREMPFFVQSTKRGFLSSFSLLVVSSLPPSSFFFPLFFSLSEHYSVTLSLASSMQLVHGPEFTINLENDHVILHGTVDESAGVILRGTVILNCHENTKIKSIILKFQGKTKVNWVEGKCNEGCMIIMQSTS